MKQEIYLHPTDFTEKEFREIGRSGLHVKSEKFYIEYGIEKAMKYYADLKETLKEKYGKYYKEQGDFTDANDMVERLIRLHEIETIERFCPECGDRLGELHFNTECYPCIYKYKED